MKSPTVDDRLVTSENEEPNNLSGISKETGFPGSNITTSSVVVGPFGVVVDVFWNSQANPLCSGTGSGLWKENVIYVCIMRHLEILVKIQQQTFGVYHNYEVN